MRTQKPAPVAAAAAAAPDPALGEAITPVPARIPIVGIGASAGGLAAIEAFFSGMPGDGNPDMAFVLVQHLDPDHKSLLSELIQRRTRMRVFEVVDGMVVQANCVYIIPPNRDMAFLNGTLQLLEPAAPRGHRLPIDFLFRSLAFDQHEHAIGIVLSGTGSDGTLGVRAIKGEGGMVMIQSPASSEFDGMPQSALATGLVDYNLPPAEMPAQLMAYVSHAFGRPPHPASAATPLSENALKKIFVMLRTHTGHDFSQYKPNTIFRRIERRMAVHQIESIGDYVKYLQKNLPEVQALFNDLLIGVTNFFRDPDAFAALEAQVIPRLFEGKPAGTPVRVWSTGCSTGEEAYSIAILLQERLEALRKSYKVQVFATDIDARAIAIARAGVYPASIAQDITPERLTRFFTAEPDGSAYRIHKSIRDLLVFSEQDVIKDPPFSKLDLISCRNLLIYLGPELQKKLISLFHYALLPGGVLFLGSSETAGEFGDLFAVLERKAKLYQRKEDFQGAQRAALGRFLPPLIEKELAEPPLPGKAALQPKLSLRELTEQTLLQQLGPVAALVNAFGDILYLHGRTGQYLEPAPGEAGINNILKMAREGLRRGLTTALHKAAAHLETVRVLGLRVRTNGHFTQVNLTVCPAAGGPAAALASPLFLVLLEKAVDVAAPVHTTLVLPAVSNEQRGLDANNQIAELNEELQAKEEYLLAAKEELETSNEELKSSNEEMQSVNEELQSTNEELETSKEEMQSINEELSTVNTELQTKVGDLSRANNDMNNLLAGTGIGTVFVDHNLRILRFTPSAAQITNLILSDIGRPVAHVVSNLVGYTSLVADLQAVLQTLVPKEVEVQASDGKCYTLRILPYRTLDNVIEGAVITFVENTEAKRAREALQKANELLRLAVVVRDAHDAITVQELDGRIIAWNPGAERLYGWSEAQALQMNVRARIPKALQEDALLKMHQLSLAQTLEPYPTQRLTKDGRTLEVSLTATALLNEAGQVYAIATTERACETPKG
ncbi:MAG: PAS domain-containing protein [Gammaproteobacteria bacterium]|uniref:chemotaxis protein CheB n=1 Tax=Rhodoferax sp. TaxID=50421 RepID=UPI0017B08529|nr:chemotaxis protein CheB [Rhodoferax sp.]MBU3899648.1 PAS domain-containing protein [Gammaproteobacteria bacterium]MBA3057209.1 PAS domain S-box protein [Rhodoferax sp.]MBU3997430.1 PAS domain-containing protein [Gammaproteobacteria bacterium]MBU4018124.1 PAS domain-containing protein [Gammaproteobacteria bacterium]MBU4080185.1 PAS domain-containing protein [Gammaproteobacteria bacterium]